MELRCLYASSYCPNMRSMKISGELHRFCLYHRRNANAAQRRWKQKKQQAKTDEDGTTSRSTKRRSGVPQNAKKPRTLKPSTLRLDNQVTPMNENPRPSNMAPSSFSDEDFNLLCELVFDTSAVTNPMHIPRSQGWWDPPVRSVWTPNDGVIL